MRLRPCDSSGSGETGRASGSGGSAGGEPWLFVAVGVVCELDGFGV